MFKDMTSRPLRSLSSIRMHINSTYMCAGWSRLCAFVFILQGYRNPLIDYIYSRLNIVRVCSTYHSAKFHCLVNRSCCRSFRRSLSQQTYSESSTFSKSWRFTACYM